EGFWEEFTRSPERQAQINYDEISYAWDKLIETFAFHAMTGTQYLPTGTPLCEQEKSFRFLAREPRTRRRLLANSLHEVLERSIHSRSPWDARVILPSRIGDPFYVFLFLKRRPGMSDEEYRMARFQLLSDYCHVTKLEHPDAVAVIGIATEAGLESRRSEDLCYLDASHWNNNAQQRAHEAQQKLGLLTKVTLHMTREHEYPVNHNGQPVSTVLSRNSPCSCGSGERFKRCCGKDLFRKRTSR